MVMPPHRRSPPLSDRALILWLALVVVGGLAVGCATMPRRTVTQLSAWCAVQAYQIGQGRTLDSVRTLGNRERIAVRQDHGRLTCLSIL